MRDSIYRSLGWGGLQKSDIFRIHPDKCNIAAINVAAGHKNINFPFTVDSALHCNQTYTMTAQSLKLRNPCD